MIHLCAIIGRNDANRTEECELVAEEFRRGLELLEGKPSRAVLRGGGHGDVPLLTRQRGTFSLPNGKVSGGVEIDATTLNMLVGGIDLENTRRRKGREIALSV